MKIRIAGVVRDSIVDGPGLRYTLFVQGCPRRCPGCHNPQTHDPEGGVETTTERLLKDVASDPLLDGVTFSGGEPFMQAAALAEMASEIRKIGLNIVVYTGYTWEELRKAKRRDWDKLISLADVIVDGPFVHELRDWRLNFKGSTNQRYIDAKKSLAKGRVVEIKSLAHMPACT
ncbi:MAG: anaerobic ribonucleoside-triphosphate reductase activating protein [Thermoguttaceae bacterium]|jgi:anaerobic ribonucleoside-triphosphate reductase activating protein